MQRFPTDSVEVLGRRAAVADSFLARLLGLAFMGRGSAPAALLIPRCRSVHTFGMKFDLDLYWLGPRGEVLGVSRAVAPRRLASCRSAESVLEVPAGG